MQYLSLTLFGSMISSGIVHNVILKHWVLMRASAESDSGEGSGLGYWNKVEESPGAKAAGAGI